jgi:hypothetical protein
MIDIEVIAVTQESRYNNAGSDPNLVALKLHVPEFPYSSEYLEKIIREIDGEIVNWDSGFPVFHKWDSEFSKSIYNLMDWDKAPVLKYETEGRSLYEWERLFNCFRVKDFEEGFAEEERTAETYVKKCRNINWLEWTDEELIRSPVYMFNYALKVCKGRLPDHLDNAMNMVSFRDPDSKYVKRYFGTKRYRIRSGKSLLNKKEEVPA